MSPVSLRMRNSCDFSSSSSTRLLSPVVSTRARYQTQGFDCSGEMSVWSMGSTHAADAHLARGDAVEAGGRHRRDEPVTPVGHQPTHEQHEAADEAGHDEQEPGAKTSSLTSRCYWRAGRTTKGVRKYSLGTTPGTSGTGVGAEMLSFAGTTSRDVRCLPSGFPTCARTRSGVAQW